MARRNLATPTVVVLLALAALTVAFSPDAPPVGPQPHRRSTI